MKANIEVQNRQEAEAIRIGLEDPELRAQAIILGMMKSLSPHIRARVMKWVQERLGEDWRGGHAVEDAGHDMPTKIVQGDGKSTAA